MSALELWRRYNELLISDETLGFWLDVSRVRFSSEFLDKMVPAMDRALAAMRQLEAGAIANPDENRMVGHYWLRTPDLAPQPALKQEIQETNSAILEFAEQIHAGSLAGADGPFRHVLNIGIGGSALGPQFVADALGTAADKLRMWFLDNTDPDGIDRVLTALKGELGRTLVTVVSKSGGTPETRNGMLEAQAAYQKAGVDFARHAVAITQVGSKLDQLAVSQGWLKRFPMWDWVGGRTSVMSAVGLLPAALQGLDVGQFLQGAAHMDRLTRNPDPQDNPAAMLALMWYHCTSGRGAKDMVILPYKDRLCLFSRYLQQLVMESLGKELDRHGKKVLQGISVYGNKGSTDQHAYVQQLRDGVPNFFATFIEVLKDRDGDPLEVEPGITSGDYLRGFWQGTRQALYESGRDSITITIREVSASTVGALVALYERAVGLYAELVNINAYHQPGVEAGKKAAATVLSLQLSLMKHLKAAKAPLTAEQLSVAVQLPDEVESAYAILLHLASNPAKGVQRTQGASPAEDTFVIR